MATFETHGSRATRILDSINPDALDIPVKIVYALALAVTGLLTEGIRPSETVDISGSVTVSDG